MQYNGNNYYASYSYFKVNGANDNYRMRIGAYNGTAGDSLRVQNGMNFTTKDRDNDAYSPNNCAIWYKGAWWYNGCHSSNLNGLYGNTEHAKGLTWSSITGYYDSVPDVEMKIRPCH